MTNTKTFRLFISSTFSDFKKEREVLHMQVFPEIENYCQENGFTFQPVDLRWGISNEAQLDQKTLELCLEEVRVCKHFPHPNFLIMAGDRYGYIPLPYMIEKKEFEDVLKYTKQNNETITIIYKPKKDSKDEIISKKPPRTTTKLELLEYWYKEDKNQIYNDSTAYILQPRRDEYKIYENWEVEESQLRTIFQNAATEIFKDEENKEYRKYFTSATEAEVIEGICDYKDKTISQNGCDGQIDKEHILGYLRTIKNPRGDYVDGAVDKVEEFKGNLNSTLIKKNIRTDTFKSVEDYEKNRLEEFKIFLLEELKKSIDTQKEKIKNISALTQEISEQNMFREEKLKGFQGREKTLKIIQEYIEKNRDKKQPLIIHGVSGMGKTSLMAKAIQEVESDGVEVTYRFVGATSGSTTIRSLLISIYEELQDQISDKITEYEVEEHKFYAQINVALSSISKPTVILIDALDQLTSKDNLEWLPANLQSSLKIVLSVLNDEKYIEDNHYYNILKIKYPQAQYVNIEEDSLESIKDPLIEDLLKNEYRRINAAQKEYLLKQWKKTNYSPLYLKIAIEEVKHWKAEDTNQKLADSVEEIIKEYIENLSSIYHHDKIVVKKVFGYINSSKDGLSEKELLEILSEDLEDEVEFQNTIKNEWHTLIKKQNSRRNKEELVLPLSIWSRLHSQLKPFIIERNIDNQPLMKFFHRQLTSVAESYISDEKIKMHSKLADYFSNTKTSSRKGKELFWQYDQLGDGFAILKLLQDVDLFFSYFETLEDDSYLINYGQKALEIVRQTNNYNDIFMYPKELSIVDEILDSLDDVCIGLVNALCGYLFNIYQDKSTSIKLVKFYENLDIALDIESYRFLSKCYQDIDIEKALDYFKITFKALDELYPSFKMNVMFLKPMEIEKEHQRYIKSVNDYCYFLRERKKEYSIALKYYDFLEKYYICTKQQLSQSNAMLLNNKALTKKRMYQYDHTRNIDFSEVEKAYHESISLYKKIGMSNTDDMAIVYFNLAAFLTVFDTNRENRRDEILEYFDKAINIMQNIFGPKNREVVYFNEQRIELINEYFDSVIAF